MRLVTLTLQNGTLPDRERVAVLDAVHAALVRVGVSPTDRFQRVLALGANDLRLDPSDPDASAPRDADFLPIEVRWSVACSVKVKRNFLKTLMDALAGIGLRPENVMVCFKETRWENGSFAGGRLLHADA